MSKICVNCVKEINDKEVFCLDCHEKVVETANERIAELEEQLHSAQAGEQFALKCCVEEVERLKQARAWERLALKRCKEAKEQLKNAIVPKFRVGQEVWFICDENDDCDYAILNKKVMAYTYNNYEGDYFEYAMSDDGTRDTIWYDHVEEKYVFATLEEALAKLKEMKGENK